jgi:hypothetical protein
MFWHQTAIFRESMNTKDLKSNAAFHINPTVIFKILKYSRIQKVDKYKPINTKNVW